MLEVSSVAAQLYRLGPGLGAIAELWARAVCEWERAVGGIRGGFHPRCSGTVHKRAPSPLLLVPVSSLVPFYPDPGLGPALVGQTCLIAGDLRGSLGCWLALGTTTRPALLFLLGLCGSAALVGEKQPCLPSCHPGSHPSPCSGRSQTKSISEKLCYPVKGELVFVRAPSALEPWEVVVGLAECLLMGLLAGEGW